MTDEKQKRRPSVSTRIKRTIKALTESGLAVHGVRLRDDGAIIEILTDEKAALISDRNEWDELLQ